MFEENGIIHSLVLDGVGGGRRIYDWLEVSNWKESQGPLWLHLDRTNLQAVLWLQNESGLEHLVVQALTGEETRPRCIIQDDDITVLLRGVNLSTAEDPEEMVSIRIWFDRNRIITTRETYLVPIADVGALLEKGKGPISTIAFFTALNDRLTVHMHEVVDIIGEQIDDLEDSILQDNQEDRSTAILKLRQMAVMLRRYLRPQHEAIHHLQISHSALFTEIDKEALRETSDRLRSYIEDLDSTRERAKILHEEVMSRSFNLTNKRMYLLAIGSLIYIPLSIIDTIMGTNIGGIPGAHHPWAFTILCLVNIAFAALIVAYLKHRRWF